MVRRAKGNVKETGRLVYMPSIEPERCPHCHSRNLAYEESKFVGLEIHAYMVCDSCHKRGLEVWIGTRCKMYAIV